MPQPTMSKFNLFGLKQYSKINLTYDVEKKAVTESTGCDVNKDLIEVSDELSFNLPTYIAVNAIPLYPSKYEIINTGKIIYSSFSAPNFSITIDDDSPFNEWSKVKQNTIGLNDLSLYNVNGRKRHFSQQQVMKESANAHAQKLIDAGILKVPSELAPTIQWHWCHLVAFRMLDSEKAQKKNNLFCGTSACNGHMTNIESAVKRFIYEFKRPLGLEVTVTMYKDSFVARRVRYRVYDKKGSQLCHTEYFDALTDIKTDTLDHFTIYNRLVDAFK